MPLLRWGLVAGALTVAAATAVSWQAGYSIEVALLRGLLAFPAVAFTAFFAELVVSTAPPAARAIGMPGMADESRAERRPPDLLATHTQRTAPADRRAAQA